MMTGEVLLGLRKLLDDCNEGDHCKFCKYVFAPGENLFEHLSANHLPAVITYIYGDLETLATSGQKER